MIVIIFGIVIWHSIKLRLRLHQERLAAIEKITPEVEAAFADISTYFSYNHYITESERKALLERYTPLYKEVSDIMRVH